MLFTTMIFTSCTIPEKETRPSQFSLTCSDNYSSPLKPFYPPKTGYFLTWNLIQDSFPPPTSSPPYDDLYSPLPHYPDVL